MVAKFKSTTLIANDMSIKVTYVLLKLFSNMFSCTSQHFIWKYLESETSIVGAGGGLAAAAAAAVFCK